VSGLVTRHIREVRSTDISLDNSYRNNSTHMIIIISTTASNVRAIRLVMQRNWRIILCFQWVRAEFLTISMSNLTASSIQKNVSTSFPGSTDVSAINYISVSCFK
jgi:hypothetical protein